MNGYPQAPVLALRGENLVSTVLFSNESNVVHAPLDDSWKDGVEAHFMSR